ncbi:polycomb complex protein BMI-1-like isoform X3 [Tachypleus tridentatus]|uniref:polycomb complex protein BMI-1-like isoform X3 n=1 Tax=Tachypleus tridentatus TaxID=6853 RepID=UPI003FD113D7
MSDLQTVEAEVGYSSPPMSNMYQPSGLHVMEVNPYLTCVLCGGYFIDATTITECLHSFCKTCIVRYLKSSKFCPICDVQVHKTRPLVNIRADKTLQDIVYKLVPGLFRNEMKRRREFYSAHPKEAAHVTCQEDRGDLTEQRVIYSPDDIISLSLEYGYGNNQLPTTFHSDDKTVSIMYYDEVLQDNYKLMDIAYIYTWKRNEPMRLFYRITDNHKKIPSTSNSTCFQTSAGVGVSETMTGSRPLLSRDTSEINTSRTDTSPAQKREKRRKPPVETRLSLKKKKRTFKNKKEKQFY